MPELAHARVAVIWIDWYPYHVARFRGLAEAFPGQVAGIELVGGIGVHTGLRFREDLPQGLPIHTLMPHTAWRDASQAELCWLLWKKLSELDPEVLLIPGYYTLPALVAALWARIHGATGVLMTESTPSDHMRTPWKELLKAFGLRALFPWAISGGRAHVDYLRQLHFDSGRITGFYDVVDNEMFRRGTADIRACDVAAGKQTARCFLYVGRLAREKNVKGLLDAWLAYRAEGGTRPLVLVGDGPEAARLKASAASSEFAADVEFPGLKSSRELLPFYAQAGCFVLPSTREPWGLVVNEAMAAGLPVLVSDRCGCAPDLVLPGVNGFLFDPLDTSSLTVLLARIAGMPDEELRRMGIAAQEQVSRYSPAQFGQSISTIANSVTGRRGRPLEGSTMEGVTR